MRQSLRRWVRLVFVPRHRDAAFWETRARAQHRAWLRLEEYRTTPEARDLRYLDVMRRMAEREEPSRELCA